MMMNNPDNTMNQARSYFAEKSPKLVMYDLDGTLVDSASDLAVATNFMLNDLGRPTAREEDVRIWIGNGIPSLVKRALANDMSGDQPHQVDDALFDRAHELFNQHYDREVGKHSQLYPGVATFLTAMTRRGIKQVVITNKSAQFTEKLLKLLNIHQHFDLFLGGDSLVEKKPHPMPLLHAVNQCAVRKEEALMIGDSCNDIKAARSAEIAVIALPYGYNHGVPIEHSSPDLVVDTLDLLL